MNTFGEPQHMTDHRCRLDRAREYVRELSGEELMEDLRQMETKARAVKMTDEAYFAAGGISQSMLQVVADNRMREYEARYVLRTLPADEPTRAMELGTAIHGVVLEGKRIDDCLRVFPAACFKSNGSLNPTLRDAWLKTLPVGCSGCKETEYRAAIKAIDSIRRRIGKLLDAPSTIREQVVLWTDATGLACKAKLDIVSPDNSLVVDLKATTSAEPRDFAAKIKSFRYDLQAVTYQEAAQEAWGHGFSFAFLPVEREDGTLHQCSEVRLLPHVEAMARDARRKYMERLATAFETGDFSDEWERVCNFVDVPSYVYKD